MEIKKWFALYTRPRHEFKALEQIKELEVETYLPTITVIKQWSDRKKKITEPLFRSYIFIFANIFLLLLRQLIPRLSELRQQ